jgi:phosphoribosylglycinamide formyltransferase-1
MTTLAVLFSGGGRTVLNLLDQIEDGKLHAKIVLAIASKNTIAGIDVLADRGIDIAIAKQDEDTTEDANSKISAWLEETKPDLILLCGYLSLLPIKPWMKGRVMNIHPSLLPEFGGKGMYGKRVHEAVIASGETISGCTVHFVDEEYDHGPTILQETCEVCSDDTPKSLAHKVFSLECHAYPNAIRMVVQN